MPSEWSSRKFPHTICLFDVDGTLTPARRSISPEMRRTLAELRKVTVVGFVGGSDLPKQIEQIGDDAIDLFDFCFAENGLTAFRLGKPLPSQSFLQFLGEDKYKKLTNFILRYIANLKIPQKRGTFIEFRRGMINVSPIGRNCSHPERDAFEVYDKEHKIRSTFVELLKTEFADYGLTYSIGGQISFDVFPAGWDKTFCLRHLETEGFDTIHFFGDKTFKGGNDYEIFSHPAVTGHTVTNPNDTQSLLKDLFGVTADGASASSKTDNSGLLPKLVTRLDAVESRLDRIENALVAISKHLEKQDGGAAERAREKAVPSKGGVTYVITNL